MCCRTWMPQRMSTEPPGRITTTSTKLDILLNKQSSQFGVYILCWYVKREVLLLACQFRNCVQQQTNKNIVCKRNILQGGAIQQATREQTSVDHIWSERACARDALRITSSVSMAALYSVFAMGICTMHDFQLFDRLLLGARWCVRARQMAQ